MSGRHPLVRCLAGVTARRRSPSRANRRRPVRPPRGSMSVPDISRPLVCPSFEADLSPSNVQTMPELVSDELTSPRFDMLLLLVFAIGALALATVGTYGLFSYLVSRRTRELGIRLALGAAPSQIMGTVLNDGL